MSKSFLLKEGENKTYSNLMYCEILKMIELLQNYLQAVDVRVGAATLIILVVPTTFSLLFWFGSTIVKVPIRLMATVVLLSLIGWVMVVIGCLIRPGNHDGSSLIFVLFGWAYVWIVGLPIMLMSLFLRGLFMLRRWWRRKMANQQMPQDCPRLLVVVLLVGVMVVHSVIVGFDSGAVWRTWSGGQYRMVHSDGFVHMQICDSSGVSDVRTEVLSGYHCEIVPVGAELLRMKTAFRSSDYIIFKVDGKWTCQ